jgi:zinc protease
MYRRLVEGNLASTAGANYDGTGLDGGRMSFVIIPGAGVTLEAVEAELDAIITEVRENGVTQVELDRAKSALEAQRVFESDNQTTLANRYGRGVALGRSVSDLDAVAGRIQALTLDDIKRAAGEFLNPHSSVTGTLTLPAAANAPTPTVAKQ